MLFYEESVRNQPVSKFVDTVDYLDFVDLDVAEMYSGKSYLNYEPLMAQLCKELKTVRLKHGNT